MGVRTRLRVAVVHDDFLIRCGLASVIRTFQGFDVGMEVASWAELPRRAGRSLDIVIAAAGREDAPASALAMIEELRSTAPSLGVVLVGRSARQFGSEVIASGSARIACLLTPSLTRETLARALATVAQGGTFIEPQILDSIVAARRRTATRQLTDREGQVLRAMAAGRSNAGIATDLFLSARAVEKHINAIFRKLDLPATTQAHARVSAVLRFLDGDVDSDAFSTDGARLRTIGGNEHAPSGHGGRAIGSPRLRTSAESDGAAIATSGRRHETAAMHAHRVGGTTRPR